MLLPNNFENEISGRFYDKEVTVLENDGGNKYVVEYNGVKCTAIFNWYTCSYYADDKYGIIKEN